MRKSKIKQISLAVCLALMPLSIYAAGLGKLNVSSGLGEPLKAEIELLSVSPEELSTLAASIASEEAYMAQGITRLGIHSNIKVELAKNADGSPILKIHSNQPISDPYLDMLIQVDWATGRLQREYTVLLDPPGYKPSDSVTTIPVTPPSVNTSSTNATVNNAATNLVDTTQPSVRKARKFRKPVVQAPVPQNEITDAATAQELTTKHGDTLISIAREMQVEGVSLDQMLVGLYENNQEAFSSGNMNRLKVGQIVKVPTKESLVSIGAQEAKQSVKVHSVNWNAYRNNLAGTVAAAPAMVETEQKQSASGKIATAEDKAAPVKAGPKDVVKLSAGDKDASKAFDAKIAALQEETTARAKSLKEAEERTSALEKQIQDMQKLLALKNQSMAALQNNAEAVTKVPDTKTENTVVAEAKDATKAEVAKPTEEKPVDNTVAVTPPVNKVEPAAPVQPQVEPGFLESLMNSADLAVLGGASGVALLGAGWMFLRNKRRKDLDSFERGILTSGGLRANTVFGNTTGNASMSDTSFLTDFAQSADGSMIDTNDVDPIAEAEVYMAYGRDAQAEEILKDAISKEPKRYELHLKLLEMYAARKDTSAFEAIAGELYTTLGADDSTWAKVAELGAGMEPENPLYNVSKAVVAAPLATQKLEATDFSDSAVSTNSDLDFSLDDDIGINAQPAVEDANSVVMDSFSSAKNVEQDVSFDLGTVDNSMDFDLGDFNTKTPVESQAVNNMDNSLAFDTEKTANDKFEEPPLDLSTMNESSEGHSAGFDMDFNLTELDGASALEQNSESPSNAMEEISFDLDFAVDTPSQSISPPSDLAATEISFDLPEIDGPVISAVEAAPQSNDFEANTFDLSSISLDLGETENELTATSPVVQMTDEPTESTDIASESPDVNIKLDLVAAYIDMDDKEGARELLEEVMKEGGVQQKLRAQHLLDSLA